jgi:large subunit ribosomal protein L30
MGAKKLRIKLVHSPIGHSMRQKRTVQSLGLRKMNQEVVRPDNEAIRGMLNKVAHLVEFEEIESSET